MGTFNLSGSGVQALSSGTTALHVTITTLPAGLTHGRANPTNHFDIALFRFSDGTGFSTAIPIAGGPDWISVPPGSTSLGYSVLNGAVLSVTEIIGVVAPTPGITVTFPAQQMPQLISPASPQTLAAQLASNAAAVGSSAAWFTVNAAALYPLLASDTYTSTVGWVMNGGVAAGHWDVGVYDESFTLLGHTGSQVQVGIGAFQTAALALTLTPGRYWLAMSADSVSLTAATFSFGGSIRIRMVGCREATGDFPLTSGPTLITPTYGVLPVFGLANYIP